MKGRKCCELDW